VTILAAVLVEEVDVVVDSEIAEDVEEIVEAMTKAAVVADVVVMVIVTRKTGFLLPNSVAWFKLAKSRA
jgi:hypothetical protein